MTVRPFFAPHGTIRSGATAIEGVKSAMARARAVGGEVAANQKERANDLNISVAKDLMNEYQYEQKILAGAFPWLFSLGLPDTLHSGPPPVHLRRRLLLDRTGRFERNSTFMLHLFSMILRHNINKAVSISAKGAAKSFKKFMKAMTDPDIDQKLKDAQESPESPEANKLHKLFLPLLRFLSTHALVTHRGIL